MTTTRFKIVKKNLIGRIIALGLEENPEVTHEESPATRARERRAQEIHTISIIANVALIIVAAATVFAVIKIALDE